MLRGRGRWLLNWYLISKKCFELYSITLLVKLRFLVLSMKFALFLFNHGLILNKIQHRQMLANIIVNLAACHAWTRRRHFLQLKNMITQKQLTLENPPEP